jgi:hypothetical protein
MLCPTCKTNRAGRSHRRGLIEYVASVVGYYPHSCRACHLRFLRLRRAQIEDTAPGHPRVEREIKATRDAMKAKRRRQELLLYSAAIIVFLTLLYYITRDHGGSPEGSAAPAPSQNAHVIVS